MRKNLFTAIASIFLFVCSQFVMGDSANGEAPEQALSRILELYKGQQWEAIVKTRCLDTRHAASAAEIAALVDELAVRYAEPDAYVALISSCEAALLKRPKVVENGEVAVFEISDSSSLTLSKMKTGSWGLYL